MTTLAALIGIVVMPFVIGYIYGRNIPVPPPHTL